MTSPKTVCLYSIEIWPTCLAGVFKKPFSELLKRPLMRPLAAGDDAGGADVPRARWRDGAECLRMLAAYCLGEYHLPPVTMPVISRGAGHRTGYESALTMG